MNLDLSALGPLAGSLARAGLPALSAILGTVVPPPFDLMVKPAFAAISWALGIDPATPTAVTDVQAKVDADPSAAAAKLQAVEDAHKDAVSEIQAYLADMQDARSTEVELVKANSVIAWGPPVLGAYNMLIFAAVVVWLLTGHAADNPIAQTIIGAILGAYATTQAFFMGSSQSAKTRTDQAIGYAAKAPAAAAPLKRGR